MTPIRDFSSLTAHLTTAGTRKRLAVVCGYDDATQGAIHRAMDEGFIDVIHLGNEQRLRPLIGGDGSRETIVDIPDGDAAARAAVQLIRYGHADVLMKGIINTDNLLHAILDKEQGLLPRGTVLTHLAVMETPAYDKLLFFSDAAVIPSPTREQHIAMLRYAINATHAFGIAEPRIALIHCTEKVSPKFPHSVDYAYIVEHAAEFDTSIIDGPMDVKTACDAHAAQTKGINSPIQGRADVLIFPNIEAANVFYKTVSFFASAQMAAILAGTQCPVVLPSRSDTLLTKYYSLAVACLLG